MSVRMIILCETLHQYICVRHVVPHSLGFFSHGFCKTLKSSGVAVSFWWPWEEVLGMGGEFLTRLLSALRKTLRRQECLIARLPAKILQTIV
jgi:hypothetical protein